MTDLVLTGLDGSNPLAFLTALGVLNVLSDRDDELRSARLSWREMGNWRPVIHGLPESDPKQAVLEAIMRDRESWRNEPAIALCYGERGDVHDLKPPPEVFHKYLSDLSSTATMTQRRSVDFAAAFATDIAADNNGNTKPTALHFTAGQQEFLGMVRTLLDELTEDDVTEALFGPWRYERKLPVLFWDSSASRDYALRASDPSKDKKAGVPGADWLAFRGLSFMRVAPAGRRILTTGCSGGWKDSRFCWPVWTAPLSRPVVHSLLGLARLASTTAAGRRSRGIGAVFESRIRRTDQGGYGSFAPASLL